MPVYEATLPVPDSIQGTVEAPVKVHYEAHHPSRGATDGRHGPKIEPDEPGHIEIDWIEGPHGEPIEPTEDQCEALVTEIEEDLYDRSLAYEE